MATFDRAFLKKQYDTLIANGMDPYEYMSADAIMSVMGDAADFSFTPISRTSARTGGSSGSGAKAGTKTGAGTGSTFGSAAAGLGADFATGATGATAGAAAKGKWFKPGGAFDKASGKLKGLYSKISSPELDWTKGSGIQAWGKDIGGMYNVGNALLQGYNAAQGLQGLADVRDAGEDTISNILSGAANSPTIYYDLSPDQRDLLRQLKRGSYSNSADLSDVDLLGALGDTAMGVLGGIPGGIPGMIIGGLGGAANSVIGDLTSASANNNAELEALYRAVLESEQYHNQMRRQRAYAGLY